MRSNLSAYAELTKPKVTLLNLAVGLTCFVLAAYPAMDWTKMILFFFAGYLACGGCCALNCAYDQDTDRLMQRTAKRAIPSGKISPQRAVVFGFALTAAGMSIGGVFLNTLTAALMVAGAVFYLLVYTIVLKRSSSFNVVVGGLAGCFAAFSGWSAAAGSLSLVPLLISAVDFLWTPGHLWALAIRRVKEYKAARIPMLPVVSGAKKAAMVTFLSNSAAIGFSLLLPFLGFSGWFYGVVAAFAGSWFMLESCKLLVYPSEATGLRVFLVSMPYLGLLMAGLILDRLFF